MILIISWSTDFSTAKPDTDPVLQCCLRLLLSQHRKEGLITGYIIVTLTLHSYVIVRVVVVLLVLTRHFARRGVPASTSSILIPHVQGFQVFESPRIKTIAT